MRTKTILLSAVLGALTSVSAMAQVFSLNAVGYVNIVVPTGFSIIANQLDSTNNNFSPLLDAQINAQAGNWDSLTFYKFINGAYTILSVDSLSQTPPWDPILDPVTGLPTSDPATNTTLNPGEATFVNNNLGAPITLTFVGSVRQGSLTNTIPTGAGGIPAFSMISSQLPQAGAMDTDLGLPEVDSDNVFVFNNTGGPTSPGYGYQSYTGDSLGETPPWDYPVGAPSHPTVGVGQGVFYQNLNSTNESWIVNFSIN